MFVTLRLSQKCRNEWMAQIKYRNHKPPPLFSYINSDATMRNQLPAAATIDGRQVVGSISEEASGQWRPLWQEKGGGLSESIWRHEGRNFTNHAADQPAKPQRFGDHNSDLTNPSPNPDLHDKQEKLQTRDNEGLSFIGVSPARRLN